MGGWSNTRVDQHIIIMGTLHTPVTALSAHISFYAKIYICTYITIQTHRHMHTDTDTHQLYGDMNWPPVCHWSHFPHLPAAGRLCWVLSVQKDRQSYTYIYIYNACTGQIQLTIVGYLGNSFPRTTLPRIKNKTKINRNNQQQQQN